MEKIAAIYTRVSTEQEFNNQITICQKYAEINGIKVFKIYSDICSGKEHSRPNFNAMIEDMRCFKFNTIIVTKLDRIGSSLANLFSLFNEFLIKGIKLEAINQNFYLGLDTVQMQSINALMEYSKNIISERTKEALKYIKRTKQLKIRGRDKKPRKKSGYFARWAKIKENKENNPVV